MFNTISNIWASINVGLGLFTRTVNTIDITVRLIEDEIKAHADVLDETRPTRVSSIHAD